MKQTIILITCIVILVVGGVTEIKYLEKSTTYLLSDIEYIQNAVQNNNFELAKEQMKKTYNTWKRNKEILNIFILHEEVDDIEEYVSELKEYIEFGNIEECSVSIAKLKETLKDTLDRHKMKIGNIL